MSHDGGTSPPTWRQVVDRGYSDDALWYTQFVNQYLALPLTLLCWRRGIRPNRISAISFFSTCASVALIVASAPKASFGASLAVYLLLTFGYVLDSCDGQLARAADWGSSMGHFLDHFLDGVKVLLVNTAIGWYLLRAFTGADDLRLLAFGAFAANLHAQTVYLLAYNFKGFVYGPKLVAGSLPTTSTRERRHLLLLQPTDFGLFVMLTLLLQRPEWFLRCYAVFGLYHLLVTVAYVVVSLITMKRVDGPGL